MKIGDKLYFAPHVPFSAVKVDAPEVVEQFHARINGYYLEPARLLGEKTHAFGAVLLLASAIDAIARYALPEVELVGKRYCAWLSSTISNTFSKKDAETFYKNFRCGLVHEARAKNGCEFREDIALPIFVEDGVMAVNWRLLAADITGALNRFCNDTAQHKRKLGKFQDMLKSDFGREFSPRKALSAVR